MPHNVCTLNENGALQMKDFLKSRGFKLKTHPDGKFWVWKSKKKGVASWDQTILQCTEDFKGFCICEFGWVTDGYSEENFKKLVDEVQADTVE
jgi:hypothetical protein